MDNILIFILIAVVGIATGLISFIIYKNSLKSQREAIEKEQRHLLENAKREAESIKKEAVVHAKELIYQAKAEAEEEIREKNKELNRVDKRLRQKGEQLEKKEYQIERKEDEINRKEKECNLREDRILEEESRCSHLIKEHVLTLERISGITAEEARQELFKDIEKKAKFESARLAKRIEDEAKENAEKKAKEIISLAVQRYASDYVPDITVTTVSLPGDEMKGRLIGREGRNIRSFEAATGVDLVIDDTPELVILSAHDPMRREIARTTLERLIADGRIHPARIEEIIEKVKKEVDTTIREEG
ncbi:Rnase Y domain-containing protein [Thermodesulfovibrionales bacterium]|nr:Rnase Y domain-containing protein [Thermodesulfovibrionales bacterium]